MGVAHSLLTRLFMISMIALRPFLRSLVLTLTLAALPSLLLAQAPTSRPKSGESRPKAERPSSTRQPSAEARRRLRQKQRGQGGERECQDE